MEWVFSVDELLEEFTHGGNVFGKFLKLNLGRW
jgi:hypothetical protein